MSFRLEKKKIAIPTFENKKIAKIYYENKLVWQKFLSSFLPVFGYDAENDRVYWNIVDENGEIFEEYNPSNHEKSPIYFNFNIKDKTNPRGVVIEHYDGNNMYISVENHTLYPDDKYVVNLVMTFDDKRCPSGDGSNWGEVFIERGGGVRYEVIKTNSVNSPIIGVEFTLNKETTFKTISFYAKPKTVDWTLNTVYYGEISNHRTSGNLNYVQNTNYSMNTDDYHEVDGVKYYKTTLTLPSSATIPANRSYFIAFSTSVNNNTTYECLAKVPKDSNVYGYSIGGNGYNLTDVDVISSDSSIIFELGS